MADQTQTVKTIVDIEDGNSRKTLADLRKEVKGYRADLSQLDRASQEYQDTLQKLAASESEVAQVNKEIRQAVRDYSASVEAANTVDEERINTMRSLNAEIRGYRDELLNLEYGTTEYYNKLRQLSTAQLSLNKINNDVRASTISMSESIANALNATAGLVGGFNALRGVITLLGVESESLEQAFVKLQAGLSIVQGLKAMADGVRAANVAFRALNATMYANPILAIIGVITILVGWIVTMKDEFSFLTDELGGVWSAIKELLPSFDSITEILQGVGTALTRYLLAPIKAFIQLVKGDFQGAIDTAKNGFDVIANYEDGVSRQAERNAERRTEKVLESIRIINKASSDELKAQIDRNNAKYGSDWKYTEDAQRLYKAYYTTLSGSYAENTAEHDNALNQMYAYERSIAERTAAERKRINDEAAKAAEEERKKRQAQLEKEAQDELKAQQGYSATMQRIAAETQKALTDTYVGSVRTNWLRSQLEANRELAQSLRTTAENDKLSWREREAAANEYRTTLLQINADQKEYDRLLEEERQSKLLEREATIAFEQQMQEFGREESPEAEMERLQGIIDANLEIATKTSFTLEARQKAWANFIQARKEFDDVEEELADNEKKRRRATLEATADFLDASSKLFGENTVASKAMAIAGATINTYLAATLALATYPPPASYIAMAASIVAGLATVAQIVSTPVPGVSDTTSSSAQSVSLPDMPEMDSNFVETHNNLDSFDRDSLNSAQPVLVAEDVTQKQRRLKIVESNVTF